MTKLRIDPEFQALIPPLTPDERQRLEDSILADGCRDALLAWDGVLIDGHNRKEICEAFGKPYRVEEVECADRLEAMIRIRQIQAARRNLTDDQRAMNAAALADLMSEKTKRERAKNAAESLHGKKPPCLENASVTKHPKENKKERSRTVAARSAGTSERKVQQAQQVRKKSPELARKVEQGKVKLAAAVKQIKKEEKTVAKAAIPANLPAKTERFELIVADIAKVNGQVTTGSADWIITDPPYPKEFLPLYGELAKFGARVLKPGGSMLVMVGQSYLPDVLAQMTPHIRYHWTLSYLTPGGQAVQLWDRKVNTFWKPVLWFCNGDYKGDWMGDVAKSAINDNDKEHHKWGQSESGMADLIERFTYPGDLIVDPFLGGGTTGVVAVTKNRRFIGIDNDPAAVEVAKQRITQAV